MEYTLHTYVIFILAGDVYWNKCTIKKAHLFSFNFFLKTNLPKWKDHNHYLKYTQVYLCALNRPSQTSMVIFLSVDQLYRTGEKQEEWSETNADPVSKVISFFRWVIPGYSKLT